MKRMVAMLLAIILLFSSTGEILANERASTGNGGLLTNELEFQTGLQAVEETAIPVSELPGEILDYCELAELSTYSAVYKNEWDKYSTNYYYNQLPEEWKKFWDAMDAVCLDYLTGYADAEDTVIESVSTPSGITVEDLKLLYVMFVCSNPQYYFLLNGFSYYTYKDEENFPIAIILFSYDAFCNGSARAAATTEFGAKIKEWEAEIKDCTTDEEKVKAIFDLICTKVTYNEDAADRVISEQESFSQSPYSTFCKETTVCAGYADAMTLLCNGAGIDAVSVTSADHQWNKIRINDSWYNYDATWGDQSSGIYYGYYARSDVMHIDNKASHVEEAYWAPYSARASLDAVPVDPWEAPGNYPTIENKTATPEIIITQNEDAFLVTIECATEGADIYYTLDDTNPSSAFSKSFKYADSFVVEADTKVKAIAVYDTYFDSDIAIGIAEMELEIDTYTITYELDGGTNHLDNPTTYQSNADEFSLYAPSKDGYTFDGWYYDSSFKTPVTTLSGESGNIKVYAKWLKNYNELLINEKTGELCGYTGEPVNVVIPNGVTRIGNYAFRDCSSLESIEISSGVTSIGNSAFENCSNLTSIEILSSVTSIEGRAFIYCSSLTEVVIPSGVTIINFDVFNGCSSLVSVVMPSRVTSIGAGAFKNCSNLTVNAP